MLNATLYHVQQPMLRTFEHAAHVRRTSDSVLMALQWSELPRAVGLGECAPRVYVTGEKSDFIIAAMEKIDLSIYEALLLKSPQDAFACLAREVQAHRSLRGSSQNCLLELSLFDLLCHLHGLSALEGLMMCTACMDVNPVAISHKMTFPVSAVIDSDISVESLAKGILPDFVKVKVTNDLNRNTRLIGAVRKLLGYYPRLIVDANMSWSYENAKHNIRTFEPFGIDYYEEPFPPRQFSVLSKLRREYGIKIMLDESLVSFGDAQMAVTQDACDAFNIRISKCGGLVSSVRLIDFALRHGIAYQIGVQVAEVGPLINASRTMAFFYGRHFTAESGQSDRFFDTFVVSPAPAVDRKLNRISRPTGVGFGLTLNNEANVYAVNSIASNQGAK